VKENEKTSETKTGAAEQPPPAALPRIALGMPIVYRASKRKGKRKYTNGLKNIQKLERGMAHASERISHGLDRGFSRFRSRTDASSKKKRDGAIVDAARNFGKGAGRTLRTASKAPNDVLKHVNTKWVTRQVRKAMRALPLLG
jgi:hypothetical protein